jgi:hypothetical protein
LGDLITEKSGCESIRLLALGGMRISQLAFVGKESGRIPMAKTKISKRSLSNLRPAKKQKNPKYTRNTGASWSNEDMRELKTMARGNTPTRVIGLKLQRSETSIRSKAQREGISLKPANQSPYTRQKRK